MRQFERDILRDLFDSVMLWGIALLVVVVTLCLLI